MLVKITKDDGSYTNIRSVESLDFAERDGRMFYRLKYGFNNYDEYDIERYTLTQHVEPMLVFVFRRKDNEPHEIECTKIESINGDIRLVTATGLTFTFDSFAYYIEEVIFRKEFK